MRNMSRRGNFGDAKNASRTDLVFHSLNEALGELPLLTVVEPGLSFLISDVFPGEHLPSVIT